MFSGNPVQTVSRPGLFTALLHRLSSGLAAQLDGERGRWFLWLPVLSGAGAGLYFSLLREPPLVLVLAVALGAAALRIFLRQTLFRFVAGSILLSLALGFGAAKLRTLSVAAPALQKSTGAVKLQGWVERWEQGSGKRGRLTLRIIAMERLAAEAWPFRVRVTMSSKHAPDIGQAVAFKAVLSPPPEPVQPGAFDFARYAWFARIGGAGFGVSRPELLETAARPPLDLRASWAITRVRAAIAARIDKHLEGSKAAIAQALIMGERAQMSEEVVRDLRNSGLFHIISISGLHMTLIAGSLFWLARFFLALSPRLALHYPIKKWAALLAVLGALIYFLLSGMAVATQRSFIMIMVVFAAVLLERPAITLRNVAFSALFILALLPESLFDVSFQMSFAATTALVAFYERFGGLLLGAGAGSLWRRMLAAPFYLLAGIGVTTVVAGAAVAPFSAYHFHNFTTYAVLGNLLGMPAVTLIVMPMALLTLFAMPLGLEALPLHIMGYGIDIMLDISKWVSSLDGALKPVPAFPLYALLCMSFGGLWLMLWGQKWRYWGLAIFALGLALAPGMRRPDILIDREGKVMAVRNAQGLLTAPPGRKGSYSLERWLEADGDARKAKDAARGEAFRCDGLSCVIAVKGRIISFVQQPAALPDDCRRASIVIAPTALGSGCSGPELVIDKIALWEKGAHAIYTGANGLSVETAAAARGDRPWVVKRHRRDLISPLPEAPRPEGAANPEREPPFSAEPDSQSSSAPAPPAEPGADN